MAGFGKSVTFSNWRTRSTGSYFTSEISKEQFQYRKVGTWKPTQAISKTLANMNKKMKILTTLICFIGFAFSTIAQDRSEQLYGAVIKNDKNKVKKLIEKDADVNYVKEAGPWMKVSVLITAVNHQNIDIVKLLLDNKADVNWKDGFKSSAILYAANTGSIEMVKLLLENGADINDNDGQGNTVLTAAKESENVALIAFVKERLNL